MPDVTRDPKAYLREVRQCLDELERLDLTPTLDLLHDAYRRGAGVYVMGNGGSASTASHMTTHLQEGWDGQGTGGLRAVCLTDNTSRLTAVANDVSYDVVFTAQLNGMVRAGDVVVLISGSGNSPNVVNAARMAKESGARVIGITGFGGGKLHAMSDCGVMLSLRRYGPVEDVHVTLAHLIPQLLRGRIQDEQRPRA
ncbi:MAG: SIS domain-containing protein [SAR202 cluster bacterium]|nr:SIS domain-containing protein [SAR202 cluster bacterium]